MSLARDSILVATARSVAGQLPSSAETSSPFTGCGQSLRCQDGPWTSRRAESTSSPRLAKNCPPMRIDGAWIFQITAVQLFDESGIAAIEERSLFERRGEIGLVHVSTSEAGLLPKPQLQHSPRQAPFKTRFSVLPMSSRRIRNRDAGETHGFDFALRLAFSARNNGASMTHAAAGRSGAPGDEAYHRLLDSSIYG